MKEKKEISISYILYPDASHLDEIEQNLLQRAKQISEKAYAPYSNFLVSACLYLSNGEIVEGVNQENASYPLGLCAERVAFFSAGVLHPNITIEKVLIIAKKRESDYQFVSPCGACRQVMFEFEEKQNRPIEVILASTTGKILKIPSVALLLPFHFGQALLL
ncbi:MAG: cytidine deaminase [Raineya sp.]